MIIVYHGVNDIHTRIVWPADKYVGDNSGYRAPHQIVMPDLIEYSSLIRFFLLRMGIITPHSNINRTLDIMMKNSYAFDFANQKKKGTYPSGIFKDCSAQKMLDTNQPVYFKRNIANIVNIALARNIVPMLVSFAYSKQFDNPMTTSAEYIGAYAQMNAILKDIAEEKNIYFYDFYSEFPQDKKYYTDGLHVTELGAELKAELFAKYIDENRIISHKPDL